MELEIEAFLPILFRVLTGFVALNILINFVLLYIRRQRINVLLSLYWPLVLAVLVTQSFFQEGDLAVTLAYGASLVPSILVSIIGFEIIGRQYPLRAYLALDCVLLLMTWLLAETGFGFTYVAMPLSIATALPLVHMSFHALVTERRHTTKLQKLFGLINIIQAIHCINFALFRMEPGAQLWGWFVTYAIYDAVAIVLPAIALENAYLSEKDRLEKLIGERTQELNQSLDESRSLLKILLHDIFSPLSAMGIYIKTLTPQNGNNRDVVDRLSKSHGALVSMVGDVKEIYLKRNRREEMKPEFFEDCCKDLGFIFAQPLKEKQVSLQCHVELSPAVSVLVDRTLFTHSILCNLVSNALKFTHPHSMINVRITEDDSNIVIEVKDQGQGMSMGLLNQLSLNHPVESTPGTVGEKGMGLGLSIVKFVVNSCGGHLKIDSRPILAFPDNHGTDVRITLNKLPGSQHTGQPA